MASRNDITQIQTDNGSISNTVQLCKDGNIITQPINDVLCSEIKPQEQEYSMISVNTGQFCKYCHEIITAQNHLDMCIKFKQHQLIEQLIITTELKSSYEKISLFMVKTARPFVNIGGNKELITQFLQDRIKQNIELEIGDINTSDRRLI